MASQTSIINYAGTKIGAEGSILTIDDNKKLARVAKAVWDIAVEATLAAHPWNFAMRRVNLPALADDDGAPLVPAFGYDLQFQRPSDLVRLIEIADVDVWEEDRGAVPPFQYEGDKILSSFPAPLKLRYVARIIDTGLFSGQFVEALACKLAMEMALPMTESGATRDRMSAAFDAAIGEAKATDGRENPPEIPPEDEWISARETGY